MDDKNSQDSNNFTKILIVIAFVVVTVALYFIMTASTKKPSAKELRSSHQDVALGGDFVVMDQNGKEFTNKDLLGKPSMIYFGFTYCPDICPASLNKLTEVMNILDKYQIDITPVFVTVDPKRDTAQIIKLYLSNFHSKFIGLTGTEEQVKTMVSLFKVYAEVMAGSDKGRNDYMINHSSFVYLLDKNGKYLQHFDISAKSDEIVEFIRINLK